MKKYLALFLTLVLVGTMGSLLVNGAEADTTPITDGFVFDIANVDTKVAAEKGLILTSQDAYNNSGAGWSILILCEKVSDNLYKAKQDATYSSTGTLPQLVVGANDIVISIHSDGEKENKDQKKQAMKVKAGMYFTLTDIDLTKSGAVSGKAKVNINNPQGEDPKPPVEEVKEVITIDGKLDDNGWKTNGWTHFDSSNSRVMNEIKPEAPRSENIDFQFRTDDTKLYVALKSNTKPFGTAAINGNGKGSNFRLWFFNDGYKDSEGHEFTTYNYFIDFVYKSGELGIIQRKNTTYNGNTSEDFVIEGLEVKSTGTDNDNFWYVEAAIPFAGIGATTGTHVYVTYSGPTEIDTAATGNQLTNNSWTYGNLGTYKDADGKDAISWAYKLWDKENDVDLTFADLKLGVVKQEEPEFTDITGEKIADPKYELELKTTPEKYKAGDTITVSVTVKNIKIDTGLALIKFYLHYDATKVEPIVKNDGDNNVDMLKFIKKAPNTEDWKDGVCLLNEEESFYDISFFSAKAASNAKEDGSVVIEVQFKVKADAKGAIAFQIPHGEKGGYGIYNIKDRAYGNAGYVLAQLDNTKPGPSSSSTSSAKPSSSTTTSTPPTGDSGMYAIVIIAMLALAGAATIAVKKRSR